MKKLLLMTAVVVALAIVGCDSGNKFKTQGERMAQQLEELCHNNDTAAVLAFEDSIRAVEEAIAATGDTAAIAAFKGAVREAHEHAAPFVVVSRIEKGENKDTVINEMMLDVMSGEVDIHALTQSLDAVLRNQIAKGEVE